ncbi:Aste57867_9573 [Aphanomyces stellatus]|uniref:Aste57867_9573 protein n=1 Tax=Aphanomyces stellatus TaxID=120398 RepID=A0A485KNI7_9STRA|nr:hypothetical protein As57867_009535 [Aphanomyces stellatus]VFT86452.1 Aste57867_9573 [Aphanomyces stellatus]
MRRAWLRKSALLLTMPRRRTASLPVPGSMSTMKTRSAVAAVAAQLQVPQTPIAPRTNNSLSWKPPRKAEGQLDNDAIEDSRGGPLTLDELQLNVLAKTPHFLNPDVRLDGDFSVTIEKAMHRDYPEIEKFRWIHQLDFATSGVMCVGLTKESTANASVLFSKKCVEKEYVALVDGTMPFAPPRGHKCVTFSRLADFVHDKENPQTKKQHEHKFTKSFKGPRTGPSLFAMDQGVVRRKHAAGGVLTPGEVEFLRKMWNDLPDDVQQTYLVRAAQDKVRFDAQVKAMECQHLPQVRYDIPLPKPATSSSSSMMARTQRQRSMSEHAPHPMVKRSRLSSIGDDDDVDVEPMGYVFDDAIATSPTDSFQMEISPAGKVSTTVAFVLGHGVLDGKPVTKVLLRPLSGRRHQLRLHLSHHGFPIVGDVTYGSEEDTAPRMMLHAWKLNLKFPSDQQRQYGTTIFKSADPFASMVKTCRVVSTMQLKQPTLRYQTNHHDSSSKHQPQSTTCRKPTTSTPRKEKTKTTREH